MLSRNDIREALLNGSLKIYPFEEKNLTGIGYNLSTTSFAFSINRGTLLVIHQRPSSKGVEHYVEIPPCDTVLFFSKEYVEVDETLAGTFHSKVSCVCRGLGHISTTLDPTWRGQLIISVSNPTSQEVEFSLDGNSGNILTMLLYRLDTPVSGSNIHDNNQGRCDLLFRHFVEPSKGVEDRTQHLLLREFALGDYADSLNGYDSFLEGYNANDRYTTRVDNLLRLRDQLKVDLVRFSDEGPREKSGYCVVRGEEDRKMIRGCVLCEIMDDEGKDLLSPIKIEQNDDREKAIDAITTCIRVVEYELATINHIRRIKWQNERVEGFASEESELQAEQRKSEKKVFMKRNFVFIVVPAALVLAALAITFGPFGVPPEVAHGLVPVLVSSAVSFAILFSKEWLKAFPNAKE